MSRMETIETWVGETPRERWIRTGLCLASALVGYLLGWVA